MTNLEIRIDRLLGAYFKALVNRNYSRAKAIATALHRLELDRAHQRFLVSITEIETYKKLDDEYPYHPPVASVAVKSARKPRVRKAAASE